MAVSRYKSCIKCKEEKDISFFHKSKSEKDGCKKYCKNCRKLLLKGYYQKNKEKVLETNKKWNDKNKEKIKKYKEQYYEENKENIKKYKKKWQEENKENINKRSKKNYIDNKEKKLKYQKEYYQKNKEKINKKFLNKYKNDIHTNIRIRITKMINNNLKKNGKRSFDILDFNKKELEEHLINTIKKEYTWKDYLNGLLHIDHIIPQSLYNFDSFEDKEFKKCWNLRNLRLITAEDNLKKSNKLDMKLIEKCGINLLLPEGVNYEC